MQNSRYSDWLRAAEDDSVLIKIQRDPLAGFSREQFIKEVKSILLTKKIDSAYFFGSFAKNKQNSAM